MQNSTKFEGILKLVVKFFPLEVDSHFYGIGIVLIVEYSWNTVRNCVKLEGTLKLLVNFI